jgi:hypothetical protein
VAGELHRDALRYAGSHEVANCRPSKIVWDSTWAARRHARLSPRLIEAAFGTALSRLLPDRVAKDVVSDHLALALERRRDRLHRYFSEVARALDGVDALLIVGPSSAKLEFFAVVITEQG